MRTILLRSGIQSASDGVLVCIVLVLMIIGAYVNVRDGRHLSPSPEGADSTTDIYLYHLGIPKPTDTIRRSLQPIRDGSLLFIAWGDEPTFAQTYYALSYLSLPRRLGEIGCGLSGRPPAVIVLSDTRDLAGVICYIVPCGADTTLISPDLGLRSTHNTESVAFPWQSFCPQ